MNEFVIQDKETGEFLDERSVFRNRKVDGGEVMYRTHKRYDNGVFLSSTYQRAAERLNIIKELCRKYGLCKSFDIVSLNKI